MSNIKKSFATIVKNTKWEVLVAAFALIFSIYYSRLSIQQSQEQVKVSKEQNELSQKQFEKQFKSSNDDFAEQMTETRVSNQVRYKYDSVMQFATLQQLKILSNQLNIAQKQLKLQSEQYGQTISILTKQANIDDLHLQNLIDSRKPVLELSLTATPLTLKEDTLVNFQFHIQNVGFTEAEISDYHIIIFDESFKKNQIISKYYFGKANIRAGKTIQVEGKISRNIFDKVRLEKFYVVAFARYKDKIFNVETFDEYSGKWVINLNNNGTNGLGILGKEEYDKLTNSLKILGIKKENKKLIMNEGWNSNNSTWSNGNGWDIDI